MNLVKDYVGPIVSGKKNVFGFKSELLFPEFRSFITKYDSICLSETKLDGLDEISGDGYKGKYLVINQVE